MNRRIIALICVIVMSISEIGCFEKNVYADSINNKSNSNTNINKTTSQLIESGLIINGRTFVPVRGVFESLGFNVEWNASENKATISNGNHAISLIKGMKWFKADGKEIFPDVPQQIYDGKFYLPLRAIGDAIGASTSWDGDNKIAHISYNGKDVYVKVSSTVTISKNTNNTRSQKQTSGVTPEFKKIMDSYEAFFDEYIAFIKKYTSAADIGAIEMLNDYLNYLDKYSKTMEEMKNWENVQMSEADNLYYIEVTTRIYSKLMTVAMQ